MTRNAPPGLHEDVVVAVAAVLAGGLTFALASWLQQGAQRARLELAQREELLATLRGLHDSDGASPGRASLDRVADLFPEQRLVWRPCMGAWFLAFDESGDDAACVGFAEPPR